MPVRVNGGVFCDQVLTGSLQHFRIIGADFSGAVDMYGQPVQGSAAEIIYTLLSDRATISIMNPITNPLGMSFALETNRADWTAAEIEILVRSLGTIGVDQVDVSNVTVEQVYYNLIPLGSGVTQFIELTDTPASYAGFAGQTVVVNATEDGLIFVPGGGTGAVTSVFGRVGVVVAEAGDYDAIQVDYDSTISGLSATDVQAAIDELDALVDTNTTDITNIENTLANLALGDLIDVDTTGAANGNVLTYNSVSGEWEPGTGGTGAVDSVFGRTGVVVAEVGDYDSDQITNVSGVTGVSVSDALDWLLANTLAPGDNVSELVNDAGYLTTISAQSIGDLSDVDITGITTGQIIEWNGTEFVPGNKTTGSTTFIGLTDTPASYTGAEGKVLQVNSAGDAVEFVTSLASEIAEDTDEPTGFLNRTDSTFSFVIATRTFTVEPLAPATSFDYYIHGVKYTVSAPLSVTIPDTTGTYFFYLDDTVTLQATLNPDFTTILVDNSYVANLTWNDTPAAGTTGLVTLGDERHGITMDSATHIHFHESFGAQYISGLALLNMSVDPANPTNADAQFIVENGYIRDEDLGHLILDNNAPVINNYDLRQNLSPVAQIPVWFRTGALGDWSKKEASSFPFIFSDSIVFIGANGRPPYNQFTGLTWQLTEAANNSFILVHYFATNDVLNPVVAIQGIENYNSKTAAQENAQTEINSLFGLPFQEFTPIATVILETRDTYTNTPKVSFQSTDEGNDYVDWRDTNVYTLNSGTGGDVSSVFGRTGDVTAEAGDYAAFYATTAQGALADTALQPGDNVSELVNDAGYITSTPTFNEVINGQPTIVFLDTVRSKTLSVSENPVVFSDSRLDNLQWIRIGNTINANSGYISEFDGTLTYASAYCVDTGLATKNIHLYINDTDLGPIGLLSGGTDASFINTTLDIDFNQGDKIRLRAADGIPGKIKDTVIKLVLKWRS
jgi:hypothetical protein